MGADIGVDERLLVRDAVCSDFGGIVRGLMGVGWALLKSVCAGITLIVVVMYG